jgi:hypothetical protein
MNEKLKQLLSENGFDENTILYRYTLPEFLEPIDDNRYKLSANPNATEVVEDLYDTGYSIAARELGKGLSCFIQKEPDYQLPEHTCVKIRLGDILSQGGLVYPDHSNFAEGSYFLTMPNGFVEVELD